MRSKTSYFNKALFCKNLIRFWPLWGGASFLGALAPLALLAQIVRGELWYQINPADFTGLYYGALCRAVPILAMLYTLLCAMAVWGYLCNARSAGLMHALPIRREGLFCTGVLSGLAMVLIPCAVTGALCVLASLTARSFDPIGLCVTVLGVLGLCVFYFASATLAAFITGNIFAIPALYFLLHFLKGFLDALLSMLAQGFVFGLDTDYSGALEFLSPTVYLLENLDFNYVREYVQENAQYGHYKTVAVTLENGWLIAVYALAGLVLLALAYALYRRRNSERAGDVVSAAWMRPLFRYGIAALVALAGGQILYAVFFESGSMFGYGYGGGFQYRLFPLILCMVLSGAIGYYAASMLLAKSLRVFRGSWRGMACVAAGAAAVCLALYLDLPGIAARVPEIGEVQEVTLRVAGNGYTFYPGKEDELLEEVRSLHRSITEDRDYILNFWAEADRSSSSAAEEWDWESVVLVYTLKNGRTMRRYYNLPLTRERIARPDTFAWRLDQLVNSPAMRAKRLHLDDTGYVPSGGYFNVDRRHENVLLSDREAAAILEALGRDAAAGTWGTYEWFGRDTGGNYAMQLNLEFRQQTEDVYSGYYDSIDIVVRPDMTSTVACLLELDLVTGEELVTYRELYPEDYAGGEAAVDVPVDTVVYPKEVVYPGEVFTCEEADSTVVFRG